MKNVNDDSGKGIRNQKNNSEKKVRDVREKELVITKKVQKEYRLIEIYIYIYIKSNTSILHKIIKCVFKINWTLTALQRRRNEAAEMKLLRPFMTFMTFMTTKQMTTYAANYGLQAY